MKNINIKEILDYFKSGKFDRAKKDTAFLIGKFPNNYFLYNLFGAILAGQKKLDEAVIYYEKSIKISPNYAEAYNNLAGILAEQKKYDKAIKYFKKAIQIKPNLAEAYYNLGNALSAIEQYDESISNYNKAIKIKPDYVKAYYNLGNIFRTLNDLQNAIGYYEKTIKIDPNHSDAYNQLAILYCDIGKVKDAQKYFQKLFKLKPDNVLYKINNVLLLTPIYNSVKEMDLYRNKFIEGIDLLKKYKYPTDQPGNEIELNFYYLAYHNKDNLEIMKKLSKLFRQIIPNINYTAKNITKQKNKKIKVGFISQHLTDHTVGKLFIGLIKNMDKEKFDITIFHTLNTKKSLIKNEIDSSANKVINLKIKIHEQQLQIENENLDIIFYPDIGMSAITYFLAFSRLAPVQIVSWGHPETTGIDTIDYFLSSALFELNNAKKKYSERLIRLSQFPLYYNPPFVQSKLVLKNQSDFNFPKKKRLYGCVQTLFKLHPEFDSIFAKILHQDIDGNIVLIGGDGKAKFWIELLKKRWSKNFPILNEKVLFTKKLSLLEFISLCNRVDVLLDPFYFGGGNTFLEAMTVGTPFITKRDKHLKTNIASAGYKQMKILNSPVAQNSKEYINLAINLAKDKEKNNLLRKKSIIAAKKYLFNNRKTLIEFEKFLIESHQAAQHGKKLKDGSVFKTK